MRVISTNRRLFRGVFLILIFAAVVQAQQGGAAVKTASSPPASSSALLAEAKAAIDEGNRQWVAGWEKGDAAMVAAIFAEDGLWLGGNGKTYKGRRQILERLEAGIKYTGAGVKITVTTTALWVDGETAYETGKYVYKYQAGGQPAVDEGRYATVWKRQPDGSWKLALDMMVP